MSKKALPKAIVRTNDRLRPASVVELPSARPPVAQEAPPAEVATHAPALADPVIEKPAPAPTLDTAELARRRMAAIAIVNRHAVVSAVGGIIPLPIVNVASVTAIIVRMVRALSKYYGVPFERDRARTIVVALVAGTMPTGLASVTTSTLLYIVPTNAVMGMAVSSITAAACTRSIGLIFLEHFESGANLADLSVPKKP
jgi:uncharacterized protein (DUF697 family)